MKLRVRHRTTYEYAEPVTLAAHLLHLRPRALPFQLVRAFASRAGPEPARERHGTDYFGNPVAWLFHQEPHSRFEIATEACVELFAAEPPASSLPWEEVAAAARCPAGWRASEFAYPSPFVPASAVARKFAQPSFPPGRPIHEAVLCLAHRIAAEFAYRPGATTLATPLARVLAQRAGVCQDFAHAMIAGLRGLGLPARYVSGYVRTRPPPGQERLRGADQSHAWVGVWLGGEEWLDLDPTNGVVAGHGHVTLGWGRDYGDVSPTRGVLLGGGAHRLTVAVDMEPEG